MKENVDFQQPHPLIHPIGRRSVGLIFILITMRSRNTTITHTEKALDSLHSKAIFPLTPRWDAANPRVIFVQRRENENQNPSSTS